MKSLGKSLRTSRRAAKYLGRSWDQQNGCEVCRKSMGTSRIAMKYLGRVWGTRRMAVKSLGRVWGPAG